MSLETFKKLPLGGVNRRALVALLADEGPAAARKLLDADRKALQPVGVEVAEDAVVLILGGSNGLTRAVALQLLFGESVAVFGVHHDSEKMQIGPHHVRAIVEDADEAGVAARFVNRDASKEAAVAEIVEALRGHYRVVHLINGIAAGVPKRHAQHGTTLVEELDVAFDPVLQVPDLSQPSNVRRYGRVEVGVASDAQVTRTLELMGTSSLLWAEALAEAGLLVSGESLVAFCDYDHPAGDPVYGMGPLADAKRTQRESMTEIADRYGARCVRVCYPAMATTALGAIPGAMFMYAVTAQILMERGEFQTIAELAHDTMALWQQPLPNHELRLDSAYQAAVPEFLRRREALTADDFPGAIAKLYE